MNYIIRVFRWLYKRLQITKENIILSTFKLNTIFFYFFNLKKANKKDISEGQIKEFISNHYRRYSHKHTLDIVSEIWKEIVRNNTIDVLKLIESNHSIKLKELYENYHNSSLAIGADDTSLLKNPFFRLRAAIRQHHQLYNFMIHKNFIPLPNKFQPNLGIHSKLIKAKLEIKSVFEHLSKTIDIKQFYRFRISEFEIPIDFLDHLYFFEVIQGFIGKTNQNFIEIGSGTGTLSLMLSEIGKHNLNMIDLAPFLINQNLLLGNEHTYLPSEYINNLEPKNIKFAVNQDSFPEISAIELEKLIKFINDCNVKYIFSYNQTSNYRNQSDYRSILLSSGFKEIISFISPMREGYKIKIFERKNLTNN